MLELESKPKNVKEAVAAGWKTAEEMYTTANSSKSTWDRFMVDVKNAISKKPDSSCFTDDITEKCITGPHNTKYYHPKVEKAFQLYLMKNQANQGRSSQVVKQAVHNIVENNGYKYTKEDICSICNCSIRTFELFAPQSVSERDFIVVGSNHKKLYTEKALKQFQAWLMKNQANQGRSSATIKEATMENLEIGAAANYVMSSGSIEAAQQFAQLLISRTEAIAKSKQLEAKNQQLEHALEYDQVKDWTPWNKLKNQWKQYFDMLRHKINYTELFDEVGLVEDKHYKKKVLGFDKFPTVLISPEAEEMLWDWLDSHN